MAAYTTNPGKASLNFVSAGGAATQHITRTFFTSAPLSRTSRTALTIVPPVANIGSEIKTLSSFENPALGNLSKYFVASNVFSSRAYPRWYVFVVGKTSCAFSTKVNPALNIGTIDIGFVGSTTSTFATASGPCTCASYVSNQSRESS
ncbi:unnamed protein product [Bathycoccus prasinos]